MEYVRVARTYRLEPELVLRLEEAAERLGQSLTVFVTRALEQALGNTPVLSTDPPAPALVRAPVATANASGHSPADPDATRLPAPGRPVRGERESAVDYGIRVKDWQRRQRV